MSSRPMSFRPLQQMRALHRIKRAADAALFYSYILVAIRIPLTVTFKLSSSSS